MLEAQPFGVAFDVIAYKVLVRGVVPGGLGYGLKEVAAYLGIEFDHHDAGEDARAVTNIDLCFDSTQGETLATTLTSEWKHDFPIRLSRHGSEKGETIKQIVLTTKGENNDLFEPAIIDLIPIQIREDFATWESNNQTLALPPSLFSSFLEYEYRGIPIRCPLNAEMVVEKLYGQSWRKPVEVTRNCVRTPRYISSRLSSFRCSISSIGARCILLKPLGDQNWRNVPLLSLRFLL